MFLLPSAATNPELSGNKKTNPRRSSVSTPNLPGTGNVPTPVREKWKDNLEAKGNIHKIVFLPPYKDENLFDVYSTLFSMEII